MIELNDTLFIAEGSHRATYRHPSDPHKCIKIVKSGALEERRKRNKKWYKRLRPLSAFDETQKEIKAYSYFGNDTRKLDHIPQFYGMIHTSLGPGMLLELIALENGTPAPKLVELLREKRHTNAIRDALITLANNLISSSTAVRDLSVHDMRVRKKPDGTLKLYIVDGLGGSELIPLSNIPLLARYKAIRRFNRFFRKIMQDYPELDLPIFTFSHE